jgi:hypothetical protein
MKKSLLLIGCTCIALLATISCTKSIEEADEKMVAENKKKSEDFQAIINTHKFRLVDFYSDKPIDYIETDAEVKQETNLKAYIKPYLLDDDNVFGPEEVLNIVQNQQKMPGVSDAVVKRNYHLSYDKDNVYLDFVTYTYTPVKYKVSEFSAGGFVIYLDWPTGARVFSRFQASN